MGHTDPCYAGSPAIPKGPLPRTFGNRSLGCIGGRLEKKWSWFLVVCGEVYSEAYIFFSKLRKIWSLIIRLTVLEIRKPEFKVCIFWYIQSCFVLKFWVYMPGSWGHCRFYLHLSYDLCYTQHQRKSGSIPFCPVYNAIF